MNSNLLFQSKGILDTDSLRVILDDPVYPPDRQLLIVDMMRKFELCFTFEGRPERHLIPDLLPKEQPELNWQENGDLRFEYHYNFLPSSVISRFIVRAHQLVARNTYWRTGVVLEYNGNKALIRADLEDKKVFISIIGTERTRREFLAIIRSHFEGIHSSIAKIVADEKAPLPSHPEIVADYRHLRQLEEMGEESFVPEGLKERVSVKRLLDGIEPYEARLKRTREEYEIMHEKGHRDIWDSDLKNTSPGIKEKNASPWISGLFYLFSAVVLLALVAIISNNISPYSLPVVIIGGILLLSIIGALQLKHDNRLADKTFLQLMMETLKRLPLIGRGKKAQ